jgi:hypothetical protein
MLCGRLPSFYLAVESLKKHRNTLNGYVMATQNFLDLGISEVAAF